MVEQSKKAWENPITKAHVIGAGVGIVATAIFCFGYPGWFMSRSAAEGYRTAAVDNVHAEYCLASYLSSGVTAAEATEIRRKGTSEQAEILVKTGHAPNEEAGRACGRALDKLSTDAQLDEAIKKAVAAAAAQDAKIAAGKEGDTKSN
ncbi:hypothetical protein FHP25_07445 [Vineibacter terrae]|uniref:Uncharacterized protein n=1 Tax=Vineibacter terrae TaxID=2586908 RepID=A0A5C8PSQ7_9HYPH|nr:hypothetical protein [Vineibacter terrae]TXL78821.1 hypothetical protein FHP25_07445 [Vineibacter terrae]